MKALLLIDIQNDFMPTGSLAVPNGNKIVAPVNAVQLHFDLVIASQDWHPASHVSFAKNHLGKKEFQIIRLEGLEQTLWPAHCVQNTTGAEFHPNLHTQKVETIFRKGTNPALDSYSAFYDNAHQKSTGLAGYLKEKGITELYFTGLAADICVYFSIKDALAEGFECVVFEDAVRALDENTYQQQQEELKEQGVNYCRTADFLK
ncbi:bifunctional nicotinamidase/pyrazinamidase [Mesonia sp. MT50]|uniref:nicotinamidase n=1 Tax=Mesonia profundi TaxID=3070998 RepID=A0ABU1A3D7_9FLAO|nr:bifunctional nicotinamidase/pyrazinamidase [Mesonia profundi]MDQ7917186.1 bifunctional nicotinamidase/pyrazinamidase [Mesonia profundi]